MECEKQFIENSYTTKQLFEFFRTTPFSTIGTSTQLQAGHMFFKNNHIVNSLIYSKKCFVPIKI